jgi:hypothetical protein
VAIEDEDECWGENKEKTLRWLLHSHRSMELMALMKMLRTHKRQKNKLRGETTAFNTG